MRKQPSPTAQNVMERDEIHSKHFLAAWYDDNRLGRALASLSVEARCYFLNKPNLQKLFLKSTQFAKKNYFLNKPNLHFFLK